MSEENEVRAMRERLRAAGKTFGWSAEGMHLSSAKDAQWHHSDDVLVFTASEVDRAVQALRAEVERKHVALRALWDVADMVNAELRIVALSPAAPDASKVEPSSNQCSVCGGPLVAGGHCMHCDSGAIT